MVSPHRTVDCGIIVTTPNVATLSNCLQTFQCAIPEGCGFCETSVHKDLHRKVVCFRHLYYIANSEVANGNLKYPVLPQQC